MDCCQKRNICQKQNGYVHYMEIRVITSGGMNAVETVLKCMQ